MTSRPILFSGPMVRALLDGSKTQTRRVVKRLPWYDSITNRWIVYSKGLIALQFNTGREAFAALPIVSPYGQPGCRLWVRETWAHGIHALAANRDEDGPFVYAASDSPQHRLGDKWKPSLHMPRRASRITLEITGVRVERLQDISEADAQAEGARECDPVSGREVLLAGQSQRGSFILHFRQLWESINGPGSWDLNPWVWVIEFKRVAP